MNDSIIRLRKGHRRVLYAALAGMYIVLALSTFTQSTQIAYASHGSGHVCVEGNPNPPDCIPPEEVAELPQDTAGTAGVCDDGGRVFSGGGTLDSNKAFECDCDAADGNLDATNCDIIRVLEIGTNVLATIAGLAVAGGFMFGSYLWMTARDNPGQIQAARQKIVWSLVALLILLFFWGFLQWLIPGGLL